jgi:FlaA1/EpsC-like NDP-sugar epimerase
MEQDAMATEPLPIWQPHPRAEAGPGEPALRTLIVATPAAARSIAASLRALDVQAGTAGQGTPAAFAEQGIVGWVAIGPVVGSDDAGPEGLRLLGHLDELERALSRERVQRALVSAPAAMVGVLERVRATLAGAGVALRFWPTLDDALAVDPARGGWLPNIAERVDPAQLLGRRARSMDQGLVSCVLTGRRVMITGAGGSIGSELARQCAAMRPSELILVERSDNALFEIDRELAVIAPGVPRRAVLHDVVDADATLRRFVELRPEIVFHAAAHKHVPMMEDHPAAAVNNNLFGTKSVADAALAVGAQRFVMISTDKAVRPTSVMGATKRLAELYIRSLNGRGATRFALVRFGNVLASACSVVPVWASQVARGGPITVTDPRMTRYFMTIPEAASLVIQAGALAQDGEPDVFVLDMGEPVRILELALRFAASCGLRGVIDWSSAPAAAQREIASLVARYGGPNGGATSGPRALQHGGGRQSIGIVFTGVRPGEKLYEELAYEAESLVKTAVDGVRAWRGAPPEPLEIAAIIAEMAAVRNSLDRAAVHAALRRAVPEWSDAEEVCPISVQTRDVAAAHAA